MSTPQDSDADDWIQAAEAGTLKLAKNSEKLRQELQQAAVQTLRRDARISLRMSSEDVLRFKRLASREGIPYQTYISSVLHKFINQQLPPE